MWAGLCLQSMNFMTCRPIQRSFQEHIWKMRTLLEIHPLTFCYTARGCTGCSEFVTSSAAPHAITSRISGRLILCGRVAAEVGHICVIKYKLGCCGLWVISTVLGISVHCRNIPASERWCHVTLVPDTAELTDAWWIVGKRELVENKFCFKLYKVLVCIPVRRHLTHSLTHSHTHSLTHSHTHSLTHSLKQAVRGVGFSCPTVSPTLKLSFNTRNRRRGACDSGTRILAMADKGR
jgi:hypothetical protein